ncbi:MAG: Transcriptional regulator, MarR family [Betaproteobacteria bacterium]|nr:Transcriptional regulator, MarR family [Betaproteobacteria bacterium]
MAERSLSKPNDEPCYCGLTRRASRSLTEIYERELAPYGITQPQFSLLRAASNSAPMGITELALQLNLDRTTLGRNLKLLEAQGLVVFVANQHDQRERLVTLTRSGAKVSKEALAAWQAAQALIRRNIGRQKLVALEQLVAEIDALVS